MDTWMKISSLLCIFGFLKEFRPSEPYITPYLMGPPFNFTKNQVSQDIYPISTYANMLSLIFVFLLTDYLRYKIVIIADALSGVFVYCGLIMFKSLFAMQVIEVFYGLFMAGEVAYYTYIYAKVDTEHFQEVTSYTRSAYLAGRALSGLVSQIIVYFSLLSYYHLQFLTVTGLILASLWALMLPSVEQSVYFHQKTSSGDPKNVSDPVEISESRVTFSYAMMHLWSDFTSAFTNTYVLKWALWSALSSCGYWQVLYYIQLLWETIRQDINDVEPPLYGMVECAYTLIGAMASMSVRKIEVDWNNVGEPVLAICATGITLVLFVMSHTQSLFLAYVTYICFTVIYHTMITVANSEVAKHINRDSYGLIFGVTTFVALLMQTGLTYIVNSILCLPARKQFVVYASYFGLLGVCFILATVTSLMLKSRNRYNFANR